MAEGFSCRLGIRKFAVFDKKNKKIKISAVFFFFSFWS